MELSTLGIQLIHGSESFRSEAYLDSKGVPTIGYGTTQVDGHPVKLGMTCTIEEAIQWFNKDSGAVLRGIERLVEVPLKQNQIDALASFCYNVGLGAFESSSLRRAINTNQTLTEDLWTRWNKIRDPKTGELIVLDGLTNRRKREFQFFIS
jgi:lysozyme